jgi:hypothetical protein
VESCCEYDDDPVSAVKWNLFGSQTTVKVSTLVRRIGFVVVIVVAQLVEALCYKPEGHGFNSQ